MVDADALEALITCPGWQWFSTYVTREWGPAGLSFQEAVRNAAKNEHAVIELQKAIAVQDAVKRLMSYPAEELAKMKQRTVAELTRTDTDVMSRRGSSL